MDEAWPGRQHEVIPRSRASDPLIGRGSRLRDLLTGPGVSYLMEAHDGLSARVIDESDLDGVWASGLGISASLGLRDCNEASWTQLLSSVESIVDGTSLPVLVDGDSGFGDFNNVRVLVRKLGERGASGVCIEDKQFPKRNSFIRGGHELVTIDEMCGKVKAARDSTPTDAFCVVARTEAFIAGQSVAEAVRRGEAYLAAGADAIVVHSKCPVPDEVLAFAEAWQRAGPLVLIPTTYPRISATEIEQAGASLVIWANHLTRASISAMRWVCDAMRRSDGPSAVEDRVASLDEVFRLLRYPELIEADERYRGLGTQRVRSPDEARSVEPIRSISR